MRFRYSYRNKAKLIANSGDSDHLPRSAASDMGLHCLQITRLGVSGLQWVNIMVHGRVKRPPHGPKKYMFFTTMEAKSEGWDPVKLA